MLCALLMAREGIKVELIDEAASIAGQSYACGLHSRSLAILREAGMHTNLLHAGRRIERLAFYEGAAPRARIDFSAIIPDLPFMLVVPQDELEAILERALASAGVHIGWNHRLADLQQVPGGAIATVEELSGTATGYDVPRWETVVARTYKISAEFVVGCDGHNSAVRRAARIDFPTLSPPELFVVYEFDTDAELMDEIRVVLNATDSNVMWPMSGRRCRWSFQWVETAPDGEFPGKERSHLWSENKGVAERTRQHLEMLLKFRAPWFAGSIENVDWAVDVQFEHRLARRFGQDRCWLAGDAAHQTGPIGVQSMNVGMREAEMLARQIKKALREAGSAAPLEEYQEQFRAEWQHLLGACSQLVPAEPPKSQGLSNTGSLLSCLPASGEELDAMLDQLGCRLQCFEPPTAQRR